jgi:hypothetical protein
LATASAAKITNTTLNTALGATAFALAPFGIDARSARPRNPVASWAGTTKTPPRCPSLSTADLESWIASAGLAHPK